MNDGERKTKNIQLIPRKYIENTIASMEIGDKAYTHAWALVHNQDYALYINLTIKLLPNPDKLKGYIQIKRTLEGYWVLEKTFDMSYCYLTKIGVNHAPAFLVKRLR